MSSQLEKEFDYYLKNQQSLVEKYDGRFVVIKECEVIGDYPTEIEAIRETQKQHELGTFLVQKCESGENNYTQTYHSRVVFN